MNNVKIREERERPPIQFMSSKEEHQREGDTFLNPLWPGDMGDGGYHPQMASIQQKGVALSLNQFSLNFYKP